MKATYTFFEHNLTENVPEIKSVDLFFNQFVTQELGETDARANPRVLIEVNEFNPIQHFGAVQMWEGTVTLHVGIDIVQSFASDSELKNNNLTYLDLFDTIYHKLQSTSSFYLPEELREEGFRIYNVERSRVQFATNENSIKVTEIEFRFIIEDNTANLEVIPVEEGTVNNIECEVTVNGEIP